MNYSFKATSSRMAFEERPDYYSRKNNSVTEELRSSFGSLYALAIRHKDWKILSANECYAKILVPEINAIIKKQGLVVIYLCESGKTVSLPFTYYQSKRPVSFQASFKIGCVYLNLLGGFILNPNISYTFKILLIKNKTLKRYQKVNWLNFDKALQVLKLL